MSPSSNKGLSTLLFTKNNSLLSAVFFIIFCLLSFSFLSPVAEAQSSAGVKLQPIMFEEKVDLGETYSMTLKVTNKGTEEEIYYFVVKNISGVNEQNAPIFAKDGEPTGYELKDWITIPSEPVTIAAGDTKGIQFDVVVPEDATPGAHFAGIFVSLIPVRPEESGTGVGFLVGSIVSMQVEGDVFEEVQIREFVTGKTLYGSPEVDFRVNVHNIGNVLETPFGPFELTDMFGNDVKMDTIIVNENGSRVFPGKRRDYEFVWKDTDLRIGRYQARVSLTYGLEEKRTVTRTTTFWVLPMNVVGPILGVLLVLILTIYFGVKITLKRKMDALHQASGGTRKVVQQKSHTSRLTFISMMLLLFTILFLVVLFVLFA